MKVPYYFTCLILAKIKNNDHISYLGIWKAPQWCLHCKDMYCKDECRFCKRASPNTDDTEPCTGNSDWHGSIKTIMIINECILTQLTSLLSSYSSPAICPAWVASTIPHLHENELLSGNADVSHTQLNVSATWADIARLAEEEKEERGCSRCQKMSLWMILPVSLPALTITGIWVV